MIDLGRITHPPGNSSPKGTVSAAATESERSGAKQSSSTCAANRTCSSALPGSTRSKACPGLPLVRSELSSVSVIKAAPAEAIRTLSQQARSLGQTRGVLEEALI